MSQFYRVTRHQQMMEKRRRDAFQLDVDRSRHDRLYNVQSRESGQIILAIQNIYQRCCTSIYQGKQRQLPSRMKDEPSRDTNQDESMVAMSHMLKVVAERMVDLYEITSVFKEQTQPHPSSTNTLSDASVPPQNKNASSIKVTTRTKKKSQRH
jgi:hypothetical protein